MPKKMGINTKAAEAKARKDAVKRDKEDLVKQKKEDDAWRDDDKHINRKLDRKNDAEKKKNEALQRKALNKAAYDEEMEQLPTKKATATVKPTKVTRLEIQSRLQEQEDKKTSEVVEKTHLDGELVENVNRMVIEGDVARNIDDAITVLNKDDELDRHPERRVKAAYAAFEEVHLARLKQENPNLRLSQLKQMLKKDWMKSPENPLNQRTATYNTKK